MGAWIEMPALLLRERACRLVAPYMGAWIEIGYYGDRLANIVVAPYMGAWIEIT